MLEKLDNDWIFLLIMLCIIVSVLFMGFMCSVVCCYFILKWLNVNLGSFSSIYFYDYSPPCKKIINELGKLPIKNVYLVRKPITPILINIFNLITCNNIEYELSKYRLYLKQQNKPSFLYHTSIIFELELPDKTVKTVWLDKNNRINLMERYLIEKDTSILCAGKIKSTNLNKHPNTILSVLETTRKRIGSKRFFNWHVYKNNCQGLTKEILITLKKYTKQNKEFVFQHELINMVNLSDFTLHVFNCFINAYNIIEHVKLSALELF